MAAVSGERVPHRKEPEPGRQRGEGRRAGGSRARDRRRGFRFGAAKIRSETIDMTRTIPGPGHEPGDKPDRVRPASATTRRSTWGERAIVLGGPAIAALWTAVSLMLDTGMETVGAAWTIAIAWTVAVLPRSRSPAGPPPPRLVRLSAATGSPGSGDVLDWSRLRIRLLRLYACRRGARTPDARGLIPTAMAGPASRR